jgi:hypothetical protein
VPSCRHTAFLAFLPTAQVPVVAGVVIPAVLQRALREGDAALDLDEEEAELVSLGRHCHFG